jgi:hypothetical protein
MSASTTTTRVAAGVTAAYLRDLTRPAPGSAEHATRRAASTVGHGTARRHALPRRGRAGAASTPHLPVRASGRDRGRLG